jgi:hypothetical protein
MNGMNRTIDKWNGLYSAAVAVLLFGLIASGCNKSANQTAANTPPNGPAQAARAPAENPAPPAPGGTQPAPDAQQAAPAPVPAPAAAAPGGRVTDGT